MAIKNYYVLVTLQPNGDYAPQFGDYDKEVVKQEKLDEYSTEKSRILTVKGASQKATNEAVKALNEKQSDKGQAFNPHKPRDIVKTLELLPDYRHCLIHETKGQALQHIGNMTSFFTRNKLTAKYKTSLDAILLNERVMYLTAVYLPSSKTR